MYICILFLSKIFHNSFTNFNLMTTINFFKLLVILKCFKSKYTVYIYIYI